jgi:GR25 family glycosyltransferase involved in LPS biosynthesis
MDGNNIADIKSIADIKNIVYINLDERPDRKTHIEQQLNKVGFKRFKRFKAIKTTNGAIGCTMSHLKCLETARDRKLTHLLVFEDDTLFLDPPHFHKQFNTFLSRHKSWDVVLLAGNNMVPYTRIDDTCIKVTYCQTTTAYLVNGSYYNTLISNIKDGLQKLMQDQANRFLYAIDKYWLTLQQKDNWYLIVPLKVIQKEGYSDIEKRVVNYNSIMKNIDKAFVHTSSSNISSKSKFSIRDVV